MEELDLKELIRIFWNKKVEMILIVAIFIVLGVIYTTVFTTPMYSSSTTLVLAGSNTSGESNTNTITTNDLTINSKLVSTYSELVTSKKVVRQVITNLGIQLDEDALRKNIKVSSREGTDMIEISVTTENPQNAAKIANETAKVFAQEISEIYNINNVHVVDEAEVNNTPSNINHQRDIVIFAFIGIVVAVMYVLICNMLDTTIKTADEIEKEFKLTVLASIPIYDAEPQKIKGRGGKR